MLQVHIHVYVQLALAYTVHEFEFLRCFVLFCMCDLTQVYTQVYIATDYRAQGL